VKDKKNKIRKIERTYEDFNWLYNELMAAYPGIIIPPIPDNIEILSFNENIALQNLEDT